MHLFLKKEAKSQPNHPSCKKSGQDLKKVVMKKMYNQKGVAKACVGKLLIIIKNSDNDDLGHKTLGHLSHHYEKF